MSVPVPTDLSVGAAPLGWKGKVPDWVQLFAESLSAQLSTSFLIGSEGAIPSPAQDLGPVLSPTQDGPGYNAEWWFFDARSGAYRPGEQGCKIGTIAMWGGGPNTMPPNWLPCNGVEISRTTYSLLFAAIGTTWGTGDGITTFNLPPNAAMFINAAGFVADPRVPINPLVSNDPNVTATSYPSQGVGSYGGGQTNAPLLASDMPNPFVQVFNQDLGFYNGYQGNPGTEINDIMPAGVTSTGGNLIYQVTDLNGNPTSGSDVFSIMPPFVTIQFMIKYQ